MSLNVILMDNDNLFLKYKTYKGFCISDKCCAYKTTFTGDHKYHTTRYFSKILKLEQDKIDLKAKCEKCGEPLIWKKMNKPRSKSGKATKA